MSQQGTFDPRTYKQTDPNWARKRRSDVLGPGTITYTREVKEGLKPNEMTYGAPSQVQGHSRNQDSFQRERDQQQRYEDQLQDERERYQDARERYQDMREDYYDRQEDLYDQRRRESQQMQRPDDYQQIPIQQGSSGGKQTGSGSRAPVEIKIQREPQGIWPRKMKSDLTRIYY